MATAFGIESNCIQEGDNEFRYWGKRSVEMHPFWASLFAFAPQISNLFSIPIFDRDVIDYFTKTFRENVEYRQTHNIIKHDFVNLLIQLIEKGYVEPDDVKDITESRKYIFLFFFLYLF